MEWITWKLSRMRKNDEEFKKWMKLCGNVIKLCSTIPESLVKKYQWQLELWTPEVMSCKRWFHLSMWVGHLFLDTLYNKCKETRNRVYVMFIVYMSKLYMCCSADRCKKSGYNWRHKDGSNWKWKAGKMVYKNLVYHNQLVYPCLEPLPVS